MALQANNRNGTRILLKNDRSMPAWVTEQSGRIGPKPPPPPLTPENGHAAPAQPQLPPKSKSQPEPDYEVIEFSNQQYSNAPLRPSSASSGSKTPDSKVKCTLCGSNSPWVTCEQCSQQIFCASCDDMYHKHPKRKDHQRKTLEQTNPPLPPKLLPGQPGPAPPVAPPRRNKRGLMTPLMQRKDQVNANVGTFVIPPSPTPSMRNGDWHGRNDTLKRNSSMFNRPLPETPRTPTTPSESSRPGTPKSVFDNIQKQPSVVLEKIKHKANATLDRMQLLQQRYRQQKEQMERDRCGSSLDQNVRSFDQWSSISPSPSHFRSGSISSGMNSSHLDLTDDSSFNMFHQRQLALQHHQMAAQRANQLGQRGMSSSVFNLNQMHRKPPVTNNGWMGNSMQQAQSMAQLNCANCTHPPQPSWGGHQHMHMPHPDPWSNHLSSQQQLNRSNLSLNIGAGYMMQPPHNGMYPPPVFMNQRNGMGQMYPQPYMGGMPVMNPGLSAMPPSASRAASRAGSRMGSPAMSRKSVTLRRKQRSSYVDDAGTDDEDSDEDDRRSIVSNRSGVSRSRQRRLSSASQFQLDEDVDAAAAKLQRSRVRSQRRDSIAKSVHNDWAPGRKAPVNNNKSVDSGFNSPLKPSRIYSDLDSEGSGTRALVQAKIEQKLKEGNLKEQKQTKGKRRSESPPKQKTSAAVQTPAAHPKKEKEDKPIVQASESEEEYEVVEEEVTDDDVEEEVPKPKSPEPPTTNGPSVEQLELPAEDEDAVSLGPPPSTPDQEWECEFCTFVNEPNIKICTICCKTPCGPPKLVGKSASPPKQVKSTAAAKDKSGTLRNESSHANDTTQSNTDTTQTSVSISATQIDNSMFTEETEDTKATTTTASSSTFINSLKKKETVDDVWAHLDEDIQTTAHEVTRKAESQGHKPTKVSTGCGTSSKSASIERQEVASVERSQAREIGTSPPPQTISTQTYDALPLRKSETKEETFQMSAAKPPQPLANDVIQQSSFPMPNKIHDMKSFENEVLNNIHNISHVPMSQYQHHPYYNPHERHQRYRSNNDLRMDDTMSLDYDSFNGMGRRHPSIGELLLSQRTSSQMHSPLAGSSYDLSYRHNGMDHHKESDLYKHTTEELNAALKYCGPDMHPLIWLRDNWPKLIQTVQSLATKYGQERAENTIGTISQMEAREALRMHTGNIWQAVSECIEQRQRKYREISSRGNFSREDVVTALTTHQGNVDLALMDLGRTQLKPFLMRIWGSPGGVENESGAMTIAPPTSQPSQSTPYTMDKDIHSFLSANASDCMQIPNATGAFTPTNQMPSPFDLPASLVNPYDINNPMPDNTSSYSADSKDYAPSPLQIDDTILNNKSMLKDLETLIGTMEQNQQKQNEQVLRSIQDMISNLKHDKPEDEFDSETMRILTKSPITNSKLKNSPKDKAAENEADVKSFMWQHIQEIMPNLVQQVEMELLEDHVETEPIKQEEEEIIAAVEQEKAAAAESVKDLPPPPPPIDQDEFLMEEVIKPNLKQASIREELPPQYVYASEIATFQMTFDKGLARPHKQEFQYDSLREASREIYKMYKAPEAPKQPMTTEVEANNQGTLDIIPATVSALSATPEPHKLTPSPVIPLTIEEVVGQAPVNENVRRAAQPPEIPPFEDLTLETMMQTVVDNASTVAAHANESDSSAPKNDTHDVDSAEKQQASSHITLPITKLATVSSTESVQGSAPSYIQLKDEVIKDASTIGTTKSEILTSVAVSPEPTTSTESTNTTETLIHSDIMTSQESSIPELTSSIQSNSISELANLLASISSQDSTSSKSSILSNTTLESVNTSESQQSIVASATAPQTVVQSISSAVNNFAPESSQESAIAVLTGLETPIQSNNVSESVINSDIPSQEPSILAPTAENQIHSTNQITATATVPADNSSSVTASTRTAEAILSTNDAQPEASPVALQTVLNSPITEKVPSTAADSTNSNQRKTSKIPVRRTASNKSLILNPTATATAVHNQQPAPQQKPTQQDAPAAVQVHTVDTKDTPSSEDNRTSDHKHDNDSEDEELYSLASETSVDYDSRTEELQSPTSTNEVFLMIHQDNGESTVDESTIIPSTSSSTLHSLTSYSSGLKSPGEFVPSGDPSKQNLSELVMDTQRLIKQMKEEINIDDFESSTDDDYTDEYSDEYDDDDEELEEEEEDDEDWEDEEDDELDDAMDDLTEEDEEQLVDTPKLSDTPDHRNEHNTSQLSNVSESSKHSLPSLSSEHPVNDHIASTESAHNISNSNEESMVYVETEGQLSELPVESVISDIRLEETPRTMAFVESENGIAEMPVESVLHVTPAEATATSPSHPDRTDDDQNASKLTSIPLAIGSVIEAENALPELPADTVLLPVTESLPLQTENTIAELPTEVVLSPAELVETPPSNERPQTPSNPDSQITTSSSPESLPLNNIHNLPSTSGSVLSSTEPTANVTTTKPAAASANLTEQTASKDKPSTSKGAKPKVADPKKTTSNGVASKAVTKKPMSASKIPKPKETAKESKPQQSTAAQQQKSATAPATKIQKPKETNATATRVQIEPKRKMPTRSKSFSGPPTPIGISSVKTITQKYLNQTQPSKNQAAAPKAPTTVARKPSITEAINRLTKPTTSSELPSTSSLFRTRTQPRIPKKKYHETCFSDDDYETTSSEEELEPLEIRQRKMSIPVFRAYPSVQEPEEVNQEELVDKFVKEELVSNIAEAQIAAALVAMKFQQDVSLWAAKECSDLDHAVALLRQECELCSGTYALNEIVSMLKCTHKCCKQCAKTYFTVQITERSINDCNCPFCKQPELNNQTEHEDENLEYFSNLDIYLKNIVEPEVHELFQRKLRDRTLLKDPNFKWCVQCSSGFFARPKQKRLICPDCGSVTCALCRKTWQKQHEGISCEKFLEWEMGNDPEVQDLGVKEHLEQNGIDCPKCKFKYSLARGGCMHFTCTQCKFEFCYGCARPFMMGAKCTISPYCAKLGLHAHHPRNCLFYLRDKLPVQLQILLKNNGVAFEVDPIETTPSEEEPGTSQKKPALCPIPIQKETPTGLMDTKCNSEVPDKHAGMCRTHYVEYLTAKVAKANIDPLPIFDLTDCVQELRRRGIPLPERGPWDTDEIYKGMCSEVIQKSIPLDVN